ncbi:uncharacterized protein LOC110945284 isoform X5 [Acanthochromis polyacanthus]|uniref:uncharacterized protein LOC110945284 isoform X5 n=1 Tax=Acanthochromis polyacanthus TaxID=80966 RepID=UPI002234569D|nr:uncharacterized protein LOC110945284 isoform X5 [Acanthochromis polyacanthus]
MSLALLALIFLVSSSLSDAVIYKSTGGEVVIPPGSAADLITAITWKHNEDIAMEWYGGEPSAFRQFNGCTTLNTLTGELTISGLTREHSGSYTAEINNKVAGTTEVRVISPVPTPTVSMWCDAEMTYCTLTCEGNTTDPELVTYSWQIPDAHKGRQVNITKEDSEPWFRCEMQNPISSETSENFSNPFLFGNRMVTIILIPCIILLLIGLVVGICIYSKCKFKKTYSPTKKEEIEIKVHSSETPESNNHTAYSPMRKDEIELTVHSPETPESNNQTENTELREVSCNGAVPSLSTEETSALIPQTSSVVPDVSRRTETSSKKEEETQALIHRSGTPESNDETATTTSKGEEAVMSVAESSSEAATDTQDQSTSRNDLTTAASTDTATTSSEGEEAVMSVAESSSEAATDSQDQSTSRNDLTTAASTETATTSSEGEEAVMSVAESSSEAATDSQDQSTSRNDLTTAASTETEESPEESNGEETTRPLLEAQNQSVSVSA